MVTETGPDGQESFPTLDMTCKRTGEKKTTNRPKSKPSLQDISTNSEPEPVENESPAEGVPPVNLHGPDEESEQAAPENGIGDEVSGGDPEVGEPDQPEASESEQEEAPADTPPVQYPDQGPSGLDLYREAAKKAGQVPAQTIQDVMALMPPEVIEWMQGKREAPAQIRQMMAGVVDRTNWFIAYSCMSMMAQTAKLQNYLSAVQDQIFDPSMIVTEDEGKLKGNWYGIMEQMVKILDFTRKFVNNSQESLTRLSNDASGVNQLLQSMDETSIKEFRDRLKAAKKKSEGKPKKKKGQ